ncbi:hypothetical protein VTN00DRAFT_2835 [Thermoascus crustaceus]|uniref:uncharacterized protein n=1 Tax=Thermoascus crustaceus TaxID=5088 RepID=UPI0037435C94
MAMREPQMRSQEVGPGASQPALSIRTNGLPSRPNQFLPQKTMDAIPLESTSAGFSQRRSPPGPLRSPNSATLSPGTFSPVQRIAEGFPGSPRSPQSPRSSNAAGSFNPITETILPGGNSPLEDYIPEPEPGNADQWQDTSKDSEVTVKESNGDDASWLPPQPEPIVARLTKVHFSCYQSHRSMPPSNNFWYPVPCMTCRKQDREVRHRCTFCCLRICADCFQALQKCKDRSLAEFMETHQI